MADMTQIPPATTEQEDIPTEHPHIVRRAGVLGGSPRIKGTRISVRLLAEFHKMGETVADILAMYPHLHPAAVYDALSYYYDHLVEIEDEIEANKLENVLEKHNAYLDEKGVVQFRDHEELE